MARKWRIIFDEALPGPYNMAKDEALLSLYCQRCNPTLRIYTWKKPTVSLGYSQKASRVLNIDECSKKNIDIVRRLTGGVAVVHGMELTYSLVCSPVDLNLPKKVKASYKVLNSFLIDFYGALGLEAIFACDMFKYTPVRLGTFCFSSCEPFDILVGGKKIGGNAQRRTRDVIFQHGSIPQELDWRLIFSLIKDIDGNLDNKVTSLGALLKKDTDFFQLRSVFLDSFIKTFGLNYEIGNLDVDEWGHLEYLVETKYSIDDWNFKDEESTLVK